MSEARYAEPAEFRYLGIYISPAHDKCSAETGEYFVPTKTDRCSKFILSL